MTHHEFLAFGKDITFGASIDFVADRLLKHDYLAGVFVDIDDLDSIGNFIVLEMKFEGFESTDISSSL